MGKAIRERDIERYLVKRAKELGGEVRKVQWIGRRGAPDRIVMLPDTTILEGIHLIKCSNTFWVELKAPGKKATAAQRREHDRMQRMGQRVEVIDSFEGVDGLFS